MSQFLTLPNSIIPLLVPGRPQYLFGGLDVKTAPTRAYVTNVAGDTTYVTLTIHIIEGNAPTTAQLITVQGCSVAGMNTVGTAIHAVTGFNTGDNSIGTVSYANATSSASVAGSGQVIMPVAETADALVNGNSLQCTMPYNDPLISQGRTVSAQVSFPALPTTATVYLMLSDDNITYYEAGTVAGVTGGVQTGGFLQLTESNARYYCLGVTGSTGATGSIIGKITG